jgi:serine phosphatase RsbU (regulator of sigma subunit)
MRSSSPPATGVPRDRRRVLAVTERDGIAAAYRDALAAYVRAPDESGLARAYRLGHRAVEAEIGLLELVGVHRAAVLDVMADAAGSEGGEGPAGTEGGERPGEILAAVDFLAESLATFEMAQRGYHEAQERAALAHEIALMLQRSLLPVDLPVPPGLDLAVRYLPAGRHGDVGGDWYDVVALGESRVALTVGDVMGHGIRQAAVMGQMRLGMRAYLLEGHPVREVVRRTDKLLQSLGDLQTATLVLGEIDLSGPKLRLVNAGHPPPVIVDPGGHAALVRGRHGRLLGLGGDAAWPIIGPEQIRSGSFVLMYTDGLLERYERAGIDSFGRLVAAIEGFTGGPDELCDRVSFAMVGDEPGDDICLLAVRVG